MLTHGDPRVATLAEALAALRAAAAETTLPLAVPSAARARRTRDTLIAQLDDYLLPRIDRLDAPLLVVVGGSTGAGKSTLINSLVEAPVSPAGALRPTTRGPVLVSHPSDAPWFRRPHLLPGLTRTAAPTNDPRTIQLVAAPALVPGLALLDAPDIDSVVAAHRELAGQLLTAADLWLFVTTAVRYADAVPWELLATARDRGTAIALVLDRVPVDGADEITQHFTEMLAAQGFGGTPLFVVPETTIDGQGLLPDKFVAPMRTWLAELARDPQVRTEIAQQTVSGALVAAGRAANELAAAADEQVAAAQALADRVRVAYHTAFSTIDRGITDGTLLRGDVLARWQEFVGTGQLLATLQARLGRLRNRIAAVLTGRPAPGTDLASALESSLIALILDAAADAAEQATFAWNAHPAGAALLATAGSADEHGPGGELTRASPRLAQRVAELISDWRQGVFELIGQEAAGKRGSGRSAYAVRAIGLLVLVGVFVPPAAPLAPDDLAIMGDLDRASRDPAARVLQAVAGDPTIRVLAIRAREDLINRITALLNDEEQRYLTLLAAVQPSTHPPRRLRGAARAVALAARAADFVPAALTAPDQLTAGEVGISRPPQAAPLPADLAAATAASEPDAAIGPDGVTGLAAATESNRVLAPSAARKVPAPREARTPTESRAAKSPRRASRAAATNQPHDNQADSDPADVAEASRRTSAGRTAAKANGQEADHRSGNGRRREAADQWTAGQDRPANRSPRRAGTPVQPAVPAPRPPSEPALGADSAVGPQAAVVPQAKATGHSDLDTAETPAPRKTASRRKAAANPADDQSAETEAIGKRKAS